jgi:hypothetical protein
MRRLLVGSGMTCGIYLETSAVDAFLANPTAFGSGPFVVSEFVLAEKARLPPSDFQARVEGLHAHGVRYVGVPPLTELMLGQTVSIPVSPIEMDVEMILLGARDAVRKLLLVRESLAVEFRRIYAERRRHYAEWLALLARGNTLLFDPQPLENRRQIVSELTLASLGWHTAPSASAPIADRMRWNLNAWEKAMLFLRLDRSRDNDKDLRNDPIDAVHWAIGAT